MLLCAFFPHFIFVSSLRFNFDKILIRSVTVCSFVRYLNVCMCVCECCVVFFSLFPFCIFVLFAVVALFVPRFYNLATSGFFYFSS